MLRPSILVLPFRARTLAPRLPPAGPPFCRLAGWTALELLVALAVLVLLTTMAVPQYRAWLAREELRQRAQALVAALALARSEAIKRGHRVNVCKSPDGTACADDGGWDRGWITHVDADADGEVDDGSAALRREGPASAITVRGNGPVDDYVSFTPIGHARRLSGALQMGTFTVCRSGQNAIEVVLANSGRVRVQRTSRRCS